MKNQKNLNTERIGAGTNLGKRRRSFLREKTCSYLDMQLDLFAFHKKYFGTKGYTFNKFIHEINGAREMAEALLDEEVRIDDYDGSISFCLKGDDEYCD